MAGTPEMLGWDSPGALARLVQHLRLGATVALPTETLYGLSCVATNAVAVQHLVRLKGIAAPRGFVALLAASADLAPFLAAGQEERTLRFLQAAWPAPLSAILAVRPGLPWAVEQEGRATAAFRVPAHAALRRLVERVGAPLVSTSANPSGAPPLADGRAIAAQFGAALAAVVLEARVARPDRVPRASTLADCTVWPPVVRRAGSYDLRAAVAAFGGPGLPPASAGA